MSGTMRSRWGLRLFAVLGTLFLLYGLLYFRTENSKLLKRAEEAQKETEGVILEQKALLERIEKAEDENKRLEEENLKLKEKQKGERERAEAAIRRAKELEQNRPETPEECSEIVSYYVQEINVWKEALDAVIKERDLLIEENKNLRQEVWNYKSLTDDMKIQLNRTNAILENNLLLQRDLSSALVRQKTEAFILKAGYVIIIGLLVWAIVK